MKIIVANWKMNPSNFKRVNTLIQGIKREIKKADKAHLIICPPFIYLSSVKKALVKTKIKVGAQDLFWRNTGPFTSAISGIMLRDLGCNYVIVGHSERRIVFGDTSEIVNKKVKAALQSKLNPILCVGEQLKERKSGKTFSILKKELGEGLRGVSRKNIKKVLIAYEPIWAVGARKSASSKEILEVTLFIRQIITRLYGKHISKRIKILYGGSVNVRNIRSIISGTPIDGLLIGRASLHSDQLSEIIKSL